MDPSRPLISADRLALAAGSGDVIVVHVAWSADGGTAAALGEFEDGHIPGAVFIDVDRDLAGEAFVDGPGRHPLPSPEAFARTMAAAGIGDVAAVIAYDTAGGSLAARLWWMLDVTGHEVALLDGGLQAWDGPIETGAPLPRPEAFFSPRPWPPEHIADATAVQEALRTGLVLDVRAPERYRGETEPIDPVAGHIPGASSAPWQGNLGDDGLFLRAGSLRERYEGLGAGSSSEVVVHCGSGVTACHGLLAMRLAGLPDAKLYEGSWSDWVSDPNRPVATGAQPGEPPGT
jgi:thiosulfate/3-mercaptopyruvate sulfurtransferase